MARLNISSGRPWDAVAVYSRAVRKGNFFETSLTSPSAPDVSILHPDDVYQQTREALNIVGESLGQAGMGFEDVIRTRCYILDTYA